MRAKFVSQKVFVILKVVVFFFALPLNIHCTETVCQLLLIYYLLISASSVKSDEGGQQGPLFYLTSFLFRHSKNNL